MMLLVEDGFDMKTAEKPGQRHVKVMDGNKEFRKSIQQIRVRLFSLRPQFYSILHASMAEEDRK